MGTVIVFPKLPIIQFGRKRETSVSELVMVNILKCLFNIKKRWNLSKHF